MFKFGSGKSTFQELGGEIHQDRKKRERTALVLFVILAIVVLNVILYMITN